MMQERNYEAVLQYMQRTGSDFQLSERVLRACGYNLQVALNGRREDALIKYRRFLRKKSLEWSFCGALWSVISQSVLKVLAYGAQKLLPQFLLSRVLRTPFNNAYHGVSGVRLRQESLCVLLGETRELSNRCLFVLISPQERSAQICRFLQNVLLYDHIVTGWMGEMEGQMRELVGVGNAPQIVVVRYNIFEEVRVVRRIVGAGNIEGCGQVEVRAMVEEGKRLYREDREILTKYYNFAQQQEVEDGEQVHFVEESRTIEEQNKQYEELRRDVERRKQEEEMVRREQEALSEERKARKDSLPEEPIVGDVVRISFRCPDGSTRVRGFLREEKVDIIYQWVELNDDIAFEENIRRFQIMYSYPPEPLCERRNMKLGEVFQTQQEKVIIKEI